MSSRQLQDVSSGLSVSADAAVSPSGHYFTGDGAFRTEEGFYQITGRMDDVINVSGHRLGTAEIEDALVRCRVSLVT